MPAVVLALIGLVLAASLWALSLLDDSGELADVRHEIAALPVIRRSAVLAILDRRLPWRWR